MCIYVSFKSGVQNRESFSCSSLILSHLLVNVLRKRPHHVRRRPFFSMALSKHWIICPINLPLKYIGGLSETSAPLSPDRSIINFSIEIARIGAPFNHFQVQVQSPCRSTGAGAHWWAWQRGSACRGGGDGWGRSWGRWGTSGTSKSFKSDQKWINL